VNASTLYVREGPGTNYRAIGYFVRDDIVEFIEANSDRTWFRVRRLSDGLTGWSYATYLVKITPPPPGTGEEYRVNADSLYVREGPGTTYRAVGYLVRNDIVELLEANSAGSWFRIRRLTDGLTGWSSSRYLVKITEIAVTALEVQKYRVTATRLHVREGPGSQYPSLGYVELNEVVTQIGINPDETWMQIQRNDGLTGWSFARYLVPHDVPPPPGPGEPPHIYTEDWYQVTATSLRMREGPRTSFASKGNLSRGESVQALGVSADQAWLHFRRLDGLTAWASLSYLQNLGKNPASVIQKVFTGVTYYRMEQSSPRTVISHILAIDTRTRGLRFLVTPPMRNNFPHLCTRKTSQFLAEQGLQIAVNGDGFHYLDPMEYDPQEYCTVRGDPIRLIGYAASRGKVYSENGVGHPILYINQRNEITFDKPKGALYHAISGDVLLVEEGRKIGGLDNTQLNPRTAVGVDKNRRWVYLCVVDGPYISTGFTFDELAALLISYGVHTGISLEGGGSSTMVVEGFDRQPRVVNTPIDANTPGKERAVGNHLGIALRK
jgi:uncharacterized protein YgiM (DUF1202 family)